MISNNKQTEIFDFYFVISYNSGVHVLDYGNNDIKLKHAVENSKNTRKIGSCIEKNHLSTKKHHTIMDFGSQNIKSPLHVTES